jgi:RimJ/RimL family protein N-acetyltransferase
MEHTVLKTARLELVAATPHLLRAEGEGREAFGRQLGAHVPGAWPPELYDDDARLWTLNALETRPDAAGWWMYYVVLADARELIGVAGYKGPPADGTVEVGYGVLDAHRRQGYATEATRALVDRAFATPGVTRVIAETLPHLHPSIGVMEKLGFTLEGEGSEEGVIRFTLPRERWIDPQVVGG